MCVLNAAINETQLRQTTNSTSTYFCQVSSGILTVSMATDEGSVSPRLRALRLLARSFFSWSFKSLQMFGRVT